MGSWTKEPRMPHFQLNIWLNVLVSKEFLTISEFPSELTEIVFFSGIECINPCAQIIEPVDKIIHKFSDSFAKFNDRFEVFVLELEFQEEQSDFFKSTENISLLYMIWTFNCRHLNHMILLTLQYYRGWNWEYSLHQFQRNQSWRRPSNWRFQKQRKMVEGQCWILRS